MRVLVTGGAGFIGSHVVARFRAAGAEVEVLDDLSTGHARRVPVGVALHRIDVCSPQAAGLASMGGFDVIAHLAAQIDVRRSVVDPLHDARINLLGTINVLEAVRGVALEKRPRVVFASTGGALYGADAPIPATETSPKVPDSPYGLSKLGAEQYFALYSRLHGIETATVRFGNVYGPEQDPHGEAGVVAIFCRRLLAGDKVVVYGDGRQTRDYVYVSDVADAMFRTATTVLPEPGDVDARAFNIGTGIERTVLDLVHALGQITGRAPTIEFAPPRLGELQRSAVAIDRAGSILSWKPQVSFEQGLERTYRWFENQLS